MYKRLQTATLFVVSTSVLILVQEVHAGYLDAFCGNAESESTLSAQVSKNFAVLDRLTGASSAGDVFGTGLPGFDTLMQAGSGSPAFDTSARYLYLYQYVFGNGGTFSSMGISNQGQPLGITSYGQWSLFLSDDTGIISTTNDFGLDGVAFSTTGPANVGVTDPSVSSSGATASLIAGDISGNSTGIGDSFAPALSGGQTMRLFGFTSNLPPQYLSFASSSFGAGGTIPVPTPEPATLVLLGAGALGWLALGGLRQRGGCLNKA